MKSTRPVAVITGAAAWYWKGLCAGSLLVADLTC